MSDLEIHQRATLLNHRKPSLVFTAPGPPVGYERVGPHHFTPKKTKDFMRAVGGHAMVAAHGVRRSGVKWPVTDWVFLDLWIFCGKTRNGRWPDADNVLKAVQDACAGILWTGHTKTGKVSKEDRCVLGRCQGLVYPADQPRVEIAVTFTEKFV